MIEDCRLLSHLGEGSSAKVYGAELQGQNNNRPLVIKFIKESFLEQYIKEVEVLDEFKNRNAYGYPTLIDHGRLSADQSLATLDF